MPVTQFDMKYVEIAGLVKFDFLGLKTLSVLKEARRLPALRGIDVALDTLAWADAQVYALLQSGATVGVFHLEHTALRRPLSHIHPTRSVDLPPPVPLSRPRP